MTGNGIEHVDVLTQTVVEMFKMLAKREEAYKKRGIFLM